MAKPFIKWAGGKRSSLEFILPRFGEISGHYFEPFLGGGAVFFGLAEVRSGPAVLGDLNRELITTFQMVREYPRDVIALLASYPISETFYYELRSVDPEQLSKIEVCARFIYLNKVGFNGLYRVNRKGQFNVPYGAKRRIPRVYDVDLILEASTALQSAVLYNQPFTQLLELARRGDLVYLDPPYLTGHTEYHSSGFTFEDWRVVAKVCEDLHSRGVKFFVSCGDDSEVVKMFSSTWNSATTQVGRAISSDGTTRGPVREWLFSNQKLGG